MIEPKVKVTIDHTLRLNESQARGLVALAGYGEDAFFRAFYQLGTHYMKPHEQDIRNLFNAIQRQLPKNLSKIDDVRHKLRALNGS